MHINSAKYILWLINCVITASCKRSRHPGISTDIADLHLLTDAFTESDLKMVNISSYLSWDQWYLLHTMTISSIRYKKKLLGN